MEAINTKAIKDAVAKKYGFDDWDSLLLSDHHIDSYINEVISEVAKQVAERQREICYKNAICEGNWRSQQGVIVSKDSVLLAPIPEII